MIRSRLRGCEFPRRDERNGRSSRTISPPRDDPACSSEDVLQGLRGRRRRRNLPLPSSSCLSFVIYLSPCRLIAVAVPSRLTQRARSNMVIKSKVATNDDPEARAQRGGAILPHNGSGHFYSRGPDPDISSLAISPDPDFSYNLRHGASPDPDFSHLEIFCIPTPRAPHREKSPNRWN